MAKTRKNAATFQERKKTAMYAQIDVWQARAARLLVILILCIHPLYFNSARYIDLTRHKFVFFVICVSVVMLFVIIIWISRMTRSPRLVPQDRLYLTDWAILGFAAVTLLSAIFSPYKGETDVWLGFSERHDGAITQLLYVAVFFIVSRWYKPRERDFTLFGVSAALVALIGIFQFYGMDFFKLWPNDMTKYHVENFYHIFFRSTLGNVDIVSSYVCVAVLLCGFLFIRMKSKWKPLWLAASALNFWLMELAGAYSGRVGLFGAFVLALPFIVESRKTLGRTLMLASSWIAVYTLQKLFYDALILQARTVGSLLPYAAAAVLLLAGGILLVRWGKEPDPDAKSKWKLGVILIAACLVTGIAGVEILGRRDEVSGKDMIYELREVLHGNVRDEFGTYRMYIWRNALEAYPNNPVIGTGPDTFYYAFPEEAHGFVGQKYENAHNEYVQILICQGIIGLVCYLVFLVGLLLKSIPKSFKNPLLMAALAAFTGYIIQAFFNISLPIVTPILWVFAGMLANRNEDAILNS